MIFLATVVFPEALPPQSPKEGYNCLLKSFLSGKTKRESKAKGTAIPEDSESV